MFDELNNKYRPTPFSVTQLNRQIRLWLEQEAEDIYVIGELSNLSQPASGHWYFTLKDETAQIRCVFFRNLNRTKLFSNGDKVIARGKLTLYEARGDYQLVVSELDLAGLGELYQLFEFLKKKLEAEGLFATSRKRALPLFPKKIAIISSKTGAALQDILTTLGRRFPLIPIFIYPSEVQGKQAAAQLILGIETLNYLKLADVIILARGGGSIEDLAAFNDEGLARAIAASLIPVVTGIGHETDFTIADFVADRRAATPTAAAELVSPDQEELFAFFKAFKERLDNAAKKALQTRSLALNQVRLNLPSVESLLVSRWQNLDYLEQQLQQYLQFYLAKSMHNYLLLSSKLQSLHPKKLIFALQEKIQQLNLRLHELTLQQLKIFAQRLELEASKLITLNPISTLKRGYTIASYGSQILTSQEQIAVGAKFKLELADGHLECRVLKKGNIDA